MREDLYHILNNGVPSEVLSKKEIIKKVKANTLDKDTLIWNPKWNDNGNSQEWKKISEVFDLKNEFAKLTSSKNHIVKYALTLLVILVPVIVCSFYIYENFKYKKAKEECEKFIHELKASQMTLDIQKQYVNYCKYAATREDATSQYYMGKIFDPEDFRFLKISKEISYALKWYKKAANKGNLDAQKRLGNLYYEGGNVPQNYSIAFNWFRKAAKQKDIHAEILLGQMYYNGNGVTKDFFKSFYWFKKAAEQNNSEAQLNLANMYYYGYGVKKNGNEAMQLYEKIAKEDKEYAQKVCMQYWTGEIIVREHPETLMFYEIAANNNNIACANILGDIYLSGDDIVQDYAKAFNWYKLAADLGNIRAHKKLGDLYKNGQGVMQDYAKALEYYQKAADYDDYSAQNEIGEMFFYGNGIKKDYKKALYWFKKASEGGGGEWEWKVYGYAKAQFNLANMYFLGIGVAKNYAEAFKWFMVIAEKNEYWLDETRTSQYLLGYMYFFGKGTKKDYTEASRWLKMAAENNDKDAINFINQNRHILGNLY